MTWPQLHLLLKQGVSLSREQRREFLLLTRERRRLQRRLGDEQGLKASRRALLLLKRKAVKKVKPDLMERVMT